MGGTSVTSRYAGAGRPSQVVVRAPRGGPDRVFIKLTKILRTSLGSGTSGAFALYQIFPNDCKDPFGGLGAGGPVGFGSWAGNGAGQFLAYTVHAFSVRLRATQPAGSTATHVCYRFCPASVGTPTDTLQIAGAPRAKSVLVAAGDGIRELRSFHTVAEVYGQTQQAVAIDDSFSALYNATPASEVRMDLAFQDTVATQQTVPILLELTQYIEFYGRQEDAVPS